MFQHNFVVKLSVVLIAICLLKNIDFLWCWLNEFDKNFYKFRQSFSWNRRLRGWSNLVLNAPFIVLKYLCYFQCSANTSLFFTAVVLYWVVTREDYVMVHQTRTPHWSSVSSPSRYWQLSRASSSENSPKVSFLDPCWN